MSATAAATVAHALSFRGVTEDPPDSNCQPFSKYLGRPCHYWCADYTVAVLRQMGVPIPEGADTASTRLNMAAWKKSGLWVPRGGPYKPGDVLFLHTSDRNGKNPDVPSHTCFFVMPKGRDARTVEGNTSPGEAGSQDNGGGVYGRIRSASIIIGAGRPAYAPEPPPIPQPEDDDMLKIVKCREHPSNGEFLTNGIDSVRTLTQAALIHGRNLGFYPQTTVEVPHEWLVWVDQVQGGAHDPTGV